MVRFTTQEKKGNTIQGNKTIPAPEPDNGIKTYANHGRNSEL
jgi:hypothetical protein